MKPEKYFWLVLCLESVHATDVGSFLDADIWSNLIVSCFSNQFMSLKKNTFDLEIIEVKCKFGDKYWFSL